MYKALKYFEVIPMEAKDKFFRIKMSGNDMCVHVFSYTGMYTHRHTPNNNTNPSITTRQRHVLFIHSLENERTTIRNIANTNLNPLYFIIKNNKIFRVIISR